jgi:2'-hydroxyisoflavone reductase
MRILVLGGTAFVGRHIVDAALRRGHDVTLFNRGRTNPDLFAEARQRVGDRSTGDLSELRNGEWDGLFDVSGRLPEQVRASADLLCGRVATYCFISSVAVYASVTRIPTDEDSRLVRYDPQTSHMPASLRYGARKAASERIIQSNYPDQGLVLRPGIVVGPYDPTNRFNHWVSRMSRSGYVLGPPRTDQPVQMIHAHDLATFAVQLMERNERGVFNCVGSPTTFADMLNSCRAAADAQCEIVWASERLLGSHGISLPFNLPESGQRDGVFLRSNERAKSRGLQNRSIEQSARSILGHIASDIEGGSPEAPVPPTEADLLSQLLNTPSSSRHTPVDDVTPVDASSDR